MTAQNNWTNAVKGKSNNNNHNDRNNENNKNGNNINNFILQGKHTLTDNLPYDPQ